MSEIADRDGSRYWIGSLIVTFLIAAIIYSLTCFRTVTWWDSLNYTIASHCLGVPGPPGSLIAVILGWIVTAVVPFYSEAFSLNLLAAGVGAATCAMVSLVTLVLWNIAGQPSTRSRMSVLFPVGFGAIVGALTFAFGDTLWLHSTKFTPYVFTAFLTVVLLWQLLSWWDTADSPTSWRRLALIAFLLGLDFSVHRTNLLAVPAVILIVLLRRPRLFSNAKVWSAILASLVIGLSFHFFIIAIASRQPFMNFGDPSTLGRFWDYVSLKQYGGGWLVNLYPRKAPFWGYQVADYFRVFATNFMTISGKWLGTGSLPTILGILGISALWKRDWKLALGLVSMFLCSSLGAIVYFNIPSDFFRPFDRHYLPSLAVFAVWVAYGLVTVVTWMLRWTTRRARPIVVFVAALFVAVPTGQVFRNYDLRDGSRNVFAYDFGRNLLATVPPDAILFTFGDMDTYPPWYLNIVEGQRPDVITINVSLLNTPWYIRQLLTRYPDLPLSLTDDEVSLLTVRRWPDTVISVPIDGTADTALLHVPPTLMNQFLMVSEQIILRMVSENRFRRPFYFSAGGGGNMPPWIAEHLRFEGLASRFMPQANPAVDLNVARRNLFEKYSFRGYADNSVTIDEATMSFAPLYWGMFYQHLRNIKQQEGTVSFTAARDTVVGLFPPRRFSRMPAATLEQIAEITQP